MTREPRRYFVGVAVTNPAPDTVLERLPQSPDDLRALSSAFQSRGFEVVDTSGWTKSEQLSEAEFSSGLDSWLGTVKLGEHDRVVVYFFGHALRSEGFGTHYLCFRGCQPEAPSNGGLAVTKLAELLVGRASPPGRAWFILDCCYAGQGSEELAAAFAHYRPVSAFKDSLSYTVTSSCGSVAQFADGEFSRALGLALPKASSMPALQRALTEELGPRARQSPTFRTPFGVRDFFDDSIAAPALTAARIEPRPRRRRRLLPAAIAAAAALAGAGALVLLTRARTPAPSPPERAPEGMVRIARAEVPLGESEVEARRLFAECRQLSDRVGCQGEDFESSAFARAVRPPGAAPATVESFYLDETEVTQRAFVRWLNESENLRVEGEGNTATVVDESSRPIVAVRAGEGAARAGAGWPSISVRSGTRHFVPHDARADAPVTLVSWHGARRYCEANGKRLPTEQEWELAAGGVTKRRFPWGDAPPAHCDQVVFARHKGRSCEHEDSNPKPVGTSRGDVTPDGLRDLGGNVTEWTSSLFSERPAPSPAPSPCGGERGPCRVLRGGSYEEPGRLLRSSLRWRYSEDDLWPNVGFRCARSAEVES